MRHATDVDEFVSGKIYMYNGGISGKTISKEGI